MGCASSKRIDTRVDVYRPAPTSFAVFDINSIEEPWLKAEDSHHQDDLEKPSPSPPHLPEPLLQKLNKAIDDVPRSWDEVSKELEDLKPAFNKPPAPPTLLALPAPEPKTKAQDSSSPAGPAKPAPPSKSLSFHTLEELEGKLKSSKPPNELKKTESMAGLNERDESTKFELNKAESRPPPVVVPGIESAGYKPVRENIFVVRDRLEKQKEGKAAMVVRRDPLSDFKDLSPPGGSDSVVLYTTSLGGVRRTFEDCNAVRSILELHRVVFDERDVSLHGEFLNELKELLGEGASVPRLFVKGKYLGGGEEVVSLNETGRLGRILSWARVERGVGRQGCAGCGGARFVPCLDCGGSCKVVVGDEKEKCQKCNENGLVHCPACAAC